MLMNAASINIKTVIKNMDDYLLRPIGEAFFSFNMQFDPDPDIVGDLEVNARGTESLMANEVRSQRLLQFLQVVQNPTLAPFAKLPYIVREIATLVLALLLLRANKALALLLNSLRCNDREALFTKAICADTPSYVGSVYGNA